MNNAQEIKNAITILEKVLASLGGAPAQTQSNELVDPPTLEPFKAALAQFVEASKNVTEQSLKDITPQIVKVFEQSFVVVRYSYHTKKTTPEQNKLIQKAFTDSITKIAKLQSANTQPHFKAILEGLNTSYWVTIDTPIQSIEAGIDAAEYNGLKVKQQKVPENSKWYDAFIHALKTLKELVSQNYKLGLDWNPKGNKTFEELLAVVKGEKTQTQGPPPPPPRQPPPPPPVQQAAPQQAATQGASKDLLLAQLNQGEDIVKSKCIQINLVLKKVDKSKPIEPVEPKQQQKPQQQAEVAPVREIQNDTWVLENYTNESYIEFKEGEIDMKQSLFVQNCVNCGIQIRGKVKTIVFQKCSKIQVFFDQAVTGFELLDSKKVDIRIFQECPSLTINNSEQVHVTFDKNKQCQIISSKTMDLNITYVQDDGELAKDQNVPEQFITLWDPETKRFDTKPLDLQFG
ncbi:hypothetical protein pb186bvf_007593 [Paramecium bursaria]